MSDTQPSDPHDRSRFMDHVVVFPDGSATWLNTPLLGKPDSPDVREVSQSASSPLPPIPPSAPDSTTPHCYQVYCYHYVTQTRSSNLLLATSLGCAIALLLVIPFWYLLPLLSQKLWSNQMGVEQVEPGL